MANLTEIPRDEFTRRLANISHQSKDPERLLYMCMGFLAGVLDERAPKDVEILTQFEEFVRRVGVKSVNPTYHEHV